MLRIVWLSMLLVGIVLFILSFILALVFKVFNLLGEISGKSAKKKVKELEKINSIKTSGSLEIEEVNSATKVKEEKVFYERGKINKKEDEVENDNTSYISDEDDNTSYISEEDRTSFIDSDEIATGDLHEDKTTFLSVEKHVVIVLEEQSSILNTVNL